ncbi:MAG: hypothetical protein AAF633_16500, partial [Chloroflexota bacterium]
MRSNNNFNPTTPLLSVMLVAIALLIIAILMLAFRDTGGSSEVAQQPPPEIDQDALVATAITGLSLTQTALPTLPPTATQLPTATPIPPTETPEPPTPTNTPEPPTETPEPAAEESEEGEGDAAAEDETEDVAVEIDATEGITDTSPIIATDELTETVDFNDSGGITSEEPITETVSTVDPALCTVGPLEAENGCTYDISVGFSVFNP